MQTRPNGSDDPYREDEGPPAGLTAKEFEDLRGQLMQLESRRRREPRDLDRLKEIVEICERLGDEKEAAEYRRVIWRIDPEDPSLRGKEISQRETLHIPDSLGVPFWKDVPRALRYPREGRGQIMVIGGGLWLAGGGFMFSLLASRGSRGIIGFLVGLFIQVIVWGIFLGYLHHVAERSAQGEEEPPDWSDFESFTQSMLIPLFESIFCLVLSMGPFLACLKLCVVSFGFTLFTLPLLGLLFLAGMLLAPMCFLAMARFKRIGPAANYGFVIGSIRKVFSDYLHLVAALGLLMAACGLVASLLTIFRPVPQVGLLVYHAATGLLFWYSGMVGFHLLGRFYLRHANKLNWFEEFVGAAPSAAEEP